MDRFQIKFKPGEKFDIDYVINACRRNPNVSFILEIPNTVGVSQSDLRRLPSNVVSIRVAGAYDDERLQAYKHSPHRVKDNYESVIYSKNEVICFIDEMESIEKGINKNWSDLQKIIYIYDSLKRKVFYDPKFESKQSDEIRSLRGLISKKTVCAGYAVIFKEILDRQGIKCHYVSGLCPLGDGSYGGHAWNIIELDGKYYPIDLTWDNTRYRSGDFRTHSFFGQDIETFNKKHLPHDCEPTYGLQSKFSTFNPNLISALSRQMERDNDYSNTTYYGVRKDGTKYMVSQIGEATINGQQFYRYWYVDIDSNGKKSTPLVLYGDLNITKFMNFKNFNKDSQKLQRISQIDYLIDNVLLSRKNIMDSLNKGTFYIGGITKNTNSNNRDYIQSVSEIKKPEDKCNLFKYPTKRYKRSDGSVIILQQTQSQHSDKLNVDVNGYSVIELVDDNGKPVLRKNTIYSEGDLLSNDSPLFVDQFLSRERLDNIVNQTGGYVGIFNSQNAIEYNSDLAEYFDISKYVSTDGKRKKAKSPLPSFEELHELVQKYEIVYDAKFLSNPDGSLPKVCERKTGKVVTDRDTINRAYLAGVWLTAAGVRIFGDETIPGEKYAFNEKSKELYELICSGMKTTVKNKGVIDTVAIFRRIDDKLTYKYSKEIISKIFKTPMQVELFNQMTYDSLGMENPSIKPVPLYTLQHAGYLANQKQSTISA